jgi:hypothetical protein
VAFPSRVDSLSGVEHFARANPHLGLHKAPGHTIHRLDPQKFQEALLQVFPKQTWGGSWWRREALLEPWTVWERRGSEGWWGTRGTWTRKWPRGCGNKGGLPPDQEELLEWALEGKEVWRTANHALTSLGSEVADAKWLGRLLAALRAFLVSLLHRGGSRKKGSP